MSKSGGQCQTWPVTDTPLEAPQCSFKGCRASATWALRWNNPKVHTPERRKIWLACDDHREHLSSFLNVRGFLRDVVPFDELDETEVPGTL